MGTPNNMVLVTATSAGNILAPRVEVLSLDDFLVHSEMLSTTDRLRMRMSAVTHGTSAQRYLIAKGLLTSPEIARAHADRLNKRLVDLDRDPPNPMLVRRLGGVSALKYGILPWRQGNGVVTILTHDPDRFETHRPLLEQLFGTVRYAVACEAQISREIERLEGEDMAELAEVRVPAEASCRTLHFKTFQISIALAGLAFLATAFLFPTLILLLVTLIAVLALACGAALKLVAAILCARHDRTFKAVQAKPSRAQRPTVSILVPLFHETEIATQLIARIMRINYPAELLDVILVLEEADSTTEKTVAQTNLPPWIRTLTVPTGKIQTKPRALNYALSFCRGSIVGVYDAEDAPEPNQIKSVVNHFGTCDPDVACLQGVLDFYNARANWMSRCFTVEYATWFRVVLPALQKLRLPVPLGGTTLFFRKEVLENLGAWDAHNVTEDADLGIRLARAGYRTEMINTVTYEEANNRIWPWVKQRSRWLKGFAITWAVHMRSPAQLWADVGARGFLGVQLLFAATLLQFLLAPVLWTFWLALFGMYHPVAAVLPFGVMIGLATVFLATELITIAIGMLAVTNAHHRHLMGWVPTLHFYFPLGALASYKAFAEILTKPFYWDKTAHGVATGMEKSQPRTDPKAGQPVLKPVSSPASNVSQRPRLGAHARLHRQLLHRARKSP